MSATGRAGPASARFRAEYAAQRAAEGRGYDRADLLSLPYLVRGPLADQWGVRARTFDAFVSRVLRPAAVRVTRPLEIVDLGAGNGWLCHRVALEGHRAVALDIRDDAVDGLSAAGTYLERGSSRFERVVASFEALPFRDGSFDIVVFNASLHYALDLDATLREAARVVRGGGKIAVLDSPFYTRESDGEAMVAEKRRTAGLRFGSRADTLLAPEFIEFLTRQRMETASRACRLSWRRHRVRYPLWYELRPLSARLRRARRPSRFDLWEATTS